MSAATPASANPFDTEAAQQPSGPPPPLDAADFGGGDAAGGHPLPGTPEGAKPSSGPAEGREDARVAWRAENAKILDSREAEEKEANEGAKAKAAEWLKKFSSDRDARIAKAKEENAAKEQAATTGPVGDTSWEKVESMIDFSFKPPQEKESERQRFKQLLQQAKAKNVPCEM